MYVIMHLSRYKTQKQAHSCPQRKEVDDHILLRFVRDKETREEMLPEKQGAPGGAVQVPLSSFPGQWPRQKQVIAPVPPRFITNITKEAITVHLFTLAPPFMGPKITGIGQNAIFN